MHRQASTDPDLAKAGDNQSSAGWRLLMIGGIGFAIGLVFMLINGDIPMFIGMAVASLAAVPALAGVGLILTGLVSGRASKRKPFA